MADPNQSRVRRLAGGTVIAIGLAHRLLVYLTYRHDLDTLLAQNPDVLTWQYPTLGALGHHLGAALLYLQQTPPLPVLLLGAAHRLFGWPGGVTAFCLVFQALLATASAWILFRLLLDLGAGARSAATWAVLLLVSVDLVIIEYNSFGQTFYEHLAMFLLLTTVLGFSALDRSGRPAHAGAMGLAIALLALTRAAFSYLFVPVAIIFLLVPRLRTRRHLALLLAPVLVLQGGWAVKNLVVHGNLSLATSTWQGSNFLHGLQGAGLGRKVRDSIETRREHYPAWFLETITRRGLNPWPEDQAFYDRFPDATKATDQTVQQAMEGTDRLTNSAAQRLLSGLYLDASMQFAVAHPLAMASKVAGSYVLFWQPIRNYGIQYVDLFFVEPVIVQPFALHRLVLATWRGALPEQVLVMTGRASPQHKDGHATVLPALSMLPLVIAVVNLIALHALLPAWLLLALWSRRRGSTPGASWNMPPVLVFAVILYVYAALVFNVAEHGENMRFRLTVEPLIWLISYVTITTLYATWRHGRPHQGTRPAPASGGAS